MHHANLRLALALLAMATTLAACGGGGPGQDIAAPAPAPAPSTELPRSAQDSLGGLMAYLKQLIADTGDAGAPVALGDAALPTADSAEPAMLH